jgi:uncharacterized OB-fold protein
VRVAAHPGLYDPTATVPSLAGSRCGACGRVAFPALAIGCDVCGAGEVSLERVALEAAGSLYTFATVHVYHGSDIEVPFTISEVQLDAGPMTRVTMAEGQADLAVGDRVRAVWRVARVDEQGNEIVEPAFVGVER